MLNWSNLLIFFLVSLQSSISANGQQAEQQQEQRQNIFGKKQENQTEVFVAGDVSPKVEQAIKETLAVAVKTWGSSGRMEYWVLGTDPNAAKKLAEKFCNRRVALGQMSRIDCLADSSNKDHGFLMYQQIGAKALASGRPRGSAGHNGGAEWGFHRMTSSLPLGFAGVLKVAGEDEQITLLHEYWHSIQNSFIQTRKHDRRRKLMGPAWFVEGSAVAMAELTAAKLWKEGTLRRWKNGPHPWQSLRVRMSNKMKSLQAKRKDCPTPLPDSYKEPCRQLAYDGGAWAVAYLLDKHGHDVLLKKFHPHVERLGWEKAFQETFGQTSKEFISEFDRFLDLPIERQLDSLPRN